MNTTIHVVSPSESATLQNCSTPRAVLQLRRSCAGDTELTSRNSLVVTARPFCLFSDCPFQLAQQNRLLSTYAPGRDLNPLARKRVETVSPTHFIHTFTQRNFRTFSTKPLTTKHLPTKHMKTEIFMPCTSHPAKPMRVQKGPSDGSWFSDNVGAW